MGCCRRRGDSHSELEEMLQPNSDEDDMDEKDAGDVEEKEIIYTHQGKVRRNE